MAKRPAAKKRRKLTSDKGIVHIKSSFNNTIITLTDPDGNTLMWTSGGQRVIQARRSQLRMRLNLAPIKSLKKL